MADDSTVPVAQPPVAPPPQQPVSLLDQGANFVGGIGKALMSLLAPVVSEGRVTNANDPGAVPAFLAFANRMAQAGAPTLGPPTPLINALPQAMTQGYSAANMADFYMDPNSPLRQQLGLETERQKIGVASDAWKLQRDKALWNLTVNPKMIETYTGQPAPGTEGGATPGSEATPGGPGGPGTVAAPTSTGASTVQPVQSTPLAEPPASVHAIASLPDVQALPDETRWKAIAAMSQANMGAAEAAQYARMLKQESAGLQIDPKTGKIMTSSAGALGVAQVMPDTFASMQKKYGINGDISDPMANLQAGANYFHEGVASDGLFNGTVRYSAGPGGLQKYLQTGQLPAETADYVVKTKAPGGPVQVAGPGAPTATPAAGAPAPTPAGAGGTNADAMVLDRVTGQMVPASILASARAAAQGAILGGNPTGMAQAYNAVMEKYFQQRAAAGTVVPVSPGVGLKTTTGEPVELPVGATVTDSPTQAELDKLVPNRLPGQDYTVQRYVGGSLAGQIKGAPELLAPRSVAVPFQQANDIQTGLQRQPAMESWQQAQSRYDLVMQALNQHTRAGDEGAILALGKVFDPGAVVREGRIQMAQQFGGLQQRLQEFMGSITGDAGMPDDVRRQVGELATAEMQTRDAAALQQVRQARSFAAANGVDPNRIMPDFETSALGADGAGPRGAMAGVTYNAPYQFDPKTAKFVRPPTAPVPAAQPARRPGAPALPAGSPAGPAAPPAASPPAPPSQQQPAPPASDKLTQRRLEGMDPGGILNLWRNMLANPGTYSNADRQLFTTYRRSHPELPQQLPAQP